MYCTKTDLELIFGVVNIAKWADASNNEDEDEIESRIEWATTRASAYVNDALRGSLYAVPFTSPYPQTIVEICAQLAGAYLYSMPRGMVDGEDQQTQILSITNDAKSTLAKIRAGLIRLDASQATSTPFTVPG